MSMSWKERSLRGGEMKSTLALKNKNLQGWGGWKGERWIGGQRNNDNQIPA